jgi:hypothetical protein
MLRPVVIAAFQSANEADDAVATLVAGGIEARAATDTAALERRCDGAFEAGIDVIVEERDAGEGIALLRRHWPDDPIEPAPAPPRCPQCGSREVSSLPRIRLFLAGTVILLTGGVLTAQRDLFLLVIGILGALLALAPARRCRSCGERWR